MTQEWFPSEESGDEEHDQGSGHFVSSLFFLLPEYDEPEHVEADPHHHQGLGEAQVLGRESEEHACAVPPGSHSDRAVVGQREIGREHLEAHPEGVQTTGDGQVERESMDVHPVCLRRQHHQGGGAVHQRGRDGEKRVYRYVLLGEGDRDSATLVAALLFTDGHCCCCCC